MLSVLIMIIGGAIAAMGLISSFAPNTKPIFEKLVPIQGIIGAILIAWSIIALVQMLGNGVFSILGIVFIVIEFIVGFLLAFALISKFVLKGDDAQLRGEELRTKLIKFQAPLGLALLVYGVWVLIKII